MEDDGKRKPFNETGLYRATTLTVLTPEEFRDSYPGWLDEHIEG